MVVAEENDSIEDDKQPNIPESVVPTVPSRSNQGDSTRISSTATARDQILFTSITPLPTTKQSNDEPVSPIRLSPLRSESISSGCDSLNNHMEEFCIKQHSLRY